MPRLSAISSRLRGDSPLQNRTQNVIVGDVSLLNQFGIWQNVDWAFSIQQIVKIPSPPNTGVADYVRYSRGDGAVDVGLNALVDHKWHRFLFGAKAGYLKALPDSQKMRVPTTDGTSTEVVDRNVHRDLGDLVTTELETFYRVSKSGVRMSLISVSSKVATVTPATTAMRHTGCSAKIRARNCIWLVRV